MTDKQRLAPVLVVGAIAAPVVLIALASRGGGSSSSSSTSGTGGSVASLAVQPRVDLRAANAEVAAAWQEVMRRSSPFEQELARDTRVVLADYPSPQECALVEHGPDSRLLGLYLADPARGVRPTILLYAGNIAAEQADEIAAGRRPSVTPRRVLLHELGHRWAYDHAKRPAAAGSVGGALGFIADAVPDGLREVDLARYGVVGMPDAYQGFQEDVAAMPPALHPWRSGCPLCLLHDKLAIARALADGLEWGATVQHAIPDGAGGTVPGILHNLQEAQALIPVVEQMVPQGAGHLAVLSQQISLAQRAFSGWQTADTVGPAADAVEAAWSQAYAFVLSVYAAARTQVAA